eukprot:CAMPEP_0117051436 /NCGR_PEP_ID=MMETSP0472-20121206/35532_1 /TAXON_ID=693140 ORGANISM="Tiarina fusus, Strain LIS" /NCGR_SAMPLE_ID=MMETSP0472 /ASSEMBLY_ACC=CAM_ASM_000603 /LENGTH=224 /DNA_ID=CAMNT_0004765635 /DNA_START=1 /DNA_END=675 /DNA_ORIENTATION=+
MASGNHYYYFDLRARGFVNRVLLAVGGEEYTDHRVSFEEWGELKPTLPLTFNQLPLYQSEEVGSLCQSDAISRHLARKFNLYGKTPKENAQIDEVYEEFTDLLNATIKVTFAEDFEAKKAAFISTDIPKHVSFAEKLLARNGTGWFVGDSLTVADIQAFHVLNNWVRPYAPELITPPVKAFLKKVREVPEVKKYLEEKLSKVTAPTFPVVKFLNDVAMFKGEFE